MAPVRVRKLSAAFGAAFLMGACGDAIGPEGAFLVNQPQWEWVSACCSLAGGERTPATEGFSYVLQFTRDGVVRGIRNDTVVVETTFRVERTAPVGGDQATNVFYGAPIPLGPGFLAATRHLLIVLEGGGMLLRSDQCADCYGDWTFLPALVVTQ